MKSLLYLTDLSKKVDNAYAYALHIAQKQNSKLHIVYVSPSFTGKSGVDNIETHPLADFYNNALEIDVEHHVVNKINNLNSIATEIELDYIPTRFTILRGDFEESINNFIKDVDISLLIMSSSTPDLLTRYVYGSFANKLLDCLDIPMLIVPDKIIFQKIENITAAVLLNQNEADYLHFTMNFAKSFDAEVKCIHIAKNEQKHSYSFEDINKWCKVVNIDTSYVEILHHNSVKGGINNYVSSNKIDMVCLFHRDLSTWKRFFERSNSKQILAHSDIPILIYHQKN